MAADLLALLIEATLASSAAILLVMAVRRPLRRLAGPAVACLAWGVVPLALLAACVPALPGAALPPSLQPVQALPGMAVAASAGAQAVAAEAAGGLVLLWIAGVLAVGLGLLARQRAFDRRIARGGAPEGPAVVGLWHPRIVLPRDFARRYSALEQALVLEHERQHLRRGDLPALALCAALRALFWFNPLIHLAAARLRQDQELACDAAVLARHPHQRRAYGEAMLKTDLAGVGAPVGCHWQSCQSLKERLMMLKQIPPGPGRRRLGLGLVAATAAFVSLASWAGPSGDAPAPPPAYLQKTTDADVLTAPTYPPQALADKVSGKVMLKVYVQPDGSVGEVIVEKSEPAGVFDAAAIEAAKSWRFSPAARTSTGEPAAGWVLVPVQFEADGTPPDDAQ